MVDEVEKDERQLRQLALFHRIYAAISVLMSFCFVPHLLLGTALATGSLPDSQMPPYPMRLLFGPLIIGFVLLVIGFYIAVGVANLFAAKWIDQRRNWTGIMVVAGVDCINVPLGTVLGICTIIVHSRSSVQERFEGGR